jgi:hypothetical protein
MDSPAVPILRRMHDGSCIINCNFCNGTGQVPTAVDAALAVVAYGAVHSCPCCGGRGTLRVKGDDQLFYHGACGGTGRLLAGAHTPVAGSAPASFACTRCTGCLAGVVSRTGRITPVAD